MWGHGHCYEVTASQLVLGKETCKWETPLVLKETLLEEVKCKILYVTELLKLTTRPPRSLGLIKMAGG